MIILNHGLYTIFVHTIMLELNHSVLLYAAFLYPLHLA